MVGKKLKNHQDSYYEENTIFISAEELHKWIEIMFLENEEMKIDFERMRESNKHIFWNLIYYFNDYHLPFEFMLPYEDTKTFDMQYEELKRTAALVKVQIQKDRIDEDLVPLSPRQSSPMQQQTSSRLTSNVT